MGLGIWKSCKLLNCHNYIYIDSNDDIFFSIHTQRPSNPLLSCQHSPPPSKRPGLTSPSWTLPRPTGIDVLDPWNAALPIHQRHPAGQPRSLPSLSLSLSLSWTSRDAPRIRWDDKKTQRSGNPELLRGRQVLTTRSPDHKHAIVPSYIVQCYCLLIT